MILVILCNTSMLYITECAENMLTLQDIRTLAIENSTGLQNTKIDLVKKQIELRQAKEGIADIIKKESTIRFSLLFNIKFPEKHGMPKEIELLTKIPEIENDIKVLNEKKNSEALKSQTTAEQAYYDVLFAQYQQQKTIDRLEQLEQSQYVIDKQVKLGKAKQSDLEYIQDSIDSLQKQSERNILTLYEKQTKLASLLGKENLLYDTVSEELQQTSFQRNQLNDITNYALEHDFELYQKRQSRILAEKETDVVMGIYKNVYSKYISDVESYIKNHKNIDYEEFIARYQYTLYNIDSPWYGSYVINLIFFKIYIPKEWFKGEYSGTRYMEDEKYQLFITLVERDKAIEEEKQTEKQLKQNIETAYSTLKTMESSIKQMEQNLQQNEIRYQKKLEENKKSYLKKLCGEWDIKSLIALGKDKNSIKQLWNFIRDEIMSTNGNYQNIKTLSSFFDLCIDVYNMTNIRKEHYEKIQVLIGKEYNSRQYIKTSESVVNGIVKEVVLNGYTMRNDVMKPIVIVE